MLQRHIGSLADLLLHSLELDVAYEGLLEVLRQFFGDFCFFILVSSGVPGTENRHF